MKERLYRSRKSRVFGGVAGGFAEYINLDPILVRIIFVIIALINGLGILIYIILWIVIPERPIDYSGVEFNSANFEKSEPESDSESSTKKGDFNIPPLPKSNDGGRIFAGIFLIAIGFIFMAERFFPYVSFRDVLPLGLVVLGIVLLWNSIRK